MHLYSLPDPTDQTEQRLANLAAFGFAEFADWTNAANAKNSPNIGHKNWHGDAGHPGLDLLNAFGVAACPDQFNVAP